MISFQELNFVLVSPKDNDRETDEDSANEDDPNPNCLNKYQLLAEAEVNLNTLKGNITLNDASFSQSSTEKHSSNSQTSSTKRKQPSKVSSQNSYFYFLLSKKNFWNIFTKPVQVKHLYSTYLSKKKHWPEPLAFFFKKYSS